jgi:hypothetical protein
VGEVTVAQFQAGVESLKLAKSRLEKLLHHPNLPPQMAQEYQRITKVRGSWFPHLPKYHSLHPFSHKRKQNKKKKKQTNRLSSLISCSSNFTLRRWAPRCSHWTLVCIPFSQHSK